jgi:hypothetical protein
MPNDTSYYCRVCGLAQKEPPWGADGRTPSFNYCDCCGVEFGYQDATVHAAKAFRRKWLERGAPWSTPKSKPNYWNLDAQLKNIAEEFR